MRALLVHNPTAGSGLPTGKELLAALDEGGLSTTYCSSKKDAYKAALAHPADIVIVAGGDGTVAKVARNLSDRKTLFAILPVGTANNIARCLGILGKAEDLARGLRGAPVKRLDIGIAAGPWGSWHFLESVGWGALAELVDQPSSKLAPAERIKNGREAFAKILAQAQPKPLKFVADDKEIEGDFLFVEVLNLGMTGPRMLISPSAELDDQRLDVVSLTAEHRQDMLDWLAQDAETPPPIDSRKARKVVLTWRDGPLRVDDEVIPEPELPSNIIIELEPDSLRVCVPPSEG